MDKKILAILAIIVVVVAAAAAAFVVLGDDDDDKDSDYTILDNNDNIKEGLTFKIASETPFEGKTTTTVVVKSVADNVATLESKIKMTIDNDAPLDMIYEFVPVDPANPTDVPEGITVDVNGNTYKYNGKATDEETFGDVKQVMSFDLDDLKVDIVAGVITKATGKVTVDFKAIKNDAEIRNVHETINISSSDAGVHIKGSGNGWQVEEMSVSAVYSDVLDKFSWEFGSATKTLISDSESYGNVTASSYSVKGDCDEYGNPADLTVIVYNGYILSIEGKDVKYKVEMY